jgi:hypothetical protein
MDPERKCNKCGQPIPPDAGQDFCPRCLLRLSLRSGEEDSQSQASRPSHEETTPADDPSRLAGTLLRYLGEALEGEQRARRRAEELSGKLHAQEAATTEALAADQRARGNLQEMSKELEARKAEAVRVREASERLALDLLELVKSSFALGCDRASLKVVVGRSVELMDRAGWGEPEMESALRSAVGAAWLELGELPKAEVMQREVQHLRSGLRGEERASKADSFHDLRCIVERKSGAPSLVVDNATLRSRLRLNAPSATETGFDVPLAQQSFNEQLERFLEHELVGAYLRNLTPERLYLASGVRVLPLAALAAQIQQLSLGTRLFRAGYLVFATSFYGNLLCFHVPSGRVVWAYADSFLSDAISYQDRSTGVWRYVPLTLANVDKAVVKLSDRIDLFLNGFLNDQLQERFHGLE